MFGNESFFTIRFSCIRVNPNLIWPPPSEIFSPRRSYRLSFISLSLAVPPCVEEGKDGEGEGEEGEGVGMGALNDNYNYMI